MSKLGEILRNLKQKEGDLKLISEPLSKGHGESKGRKIIITLVLIILFVGSISGGFFLIKILSNLKEKTNKERLATKSPPHLSQSVAENQSLPSTKSNLVESVPSEKEATVARNEERKEALSSNENKTKETKVVKESLNKRKRVIPLGSHEPLYKRTKLTAQKEEVQISSQRSSPQDKTPILKDRKLIDNLLLNAEEARIKGNIEEAITFYTVYLKFREDPDALNNLAGLYLIKGEYKKAENLFEKALSIRYDETFEINLLITLWKQGKRGKVCQYLKEKNFSPALKEQWEILRDFCK